MLKRSTRAVLLVVGLLAAGTACSDDPGDPGGDPANISLVDGNDQEAEAGTALPAPLRVLVTDEDGVPLEGITVEWNVATGTGSVPPSTVTGFDGVASATFTLGPEIGEQIARAELDGVSGSPVVFSATATGDAQPAIQLVSVTPIPADYGIHDTFVRDGLAFVFAWNTGVRIYDVGNGIRSGTPAVPQLVGSVVTGTANGGMVSPSAHNGWWFHNPANGEKRYLFVGQEGPGSIGTSSSGDIHVVDVSNLSAPVEVAFYHHPERPDGLGTMRTTGAHNFWVDEASQILYAAFYNGGVVALDVSGTLSGDLSSRVLSELRPGGAGGTYTWGVHLANGSLYAIDMLSGLHQLKSQAGTLTHAGGGANVPERFSSDLWVHGTHAYSGTWGTRSTGTGTLTGNVLKVWTLSPDGAPTLANSVTIPGITTVSDVEVSPDGTWMMLTGEYGAEAGLYLYALPNPANPVFIDRFLVPSGSGGLHTGTIATIGGRKYVFAARDPTPGGPALMIFDVTSVLP